jgi:hypothetical protein
LVKVNETVEVLPESVVSVNTYSTVVVEVPHLQHTKLSAFRVKVVFVEVFARKVDWVVEELVSVKPESR